MHSKSKRRPNGAPSFIPTGHLRHEANRHNFSSHVASRLEWQNERFCWGRHMTKRALGTAFCLFLSCAGFSASAAEGDQAAPQVSGSEAQATLARITISSPKFAFRKDSFLEKAVISFAITNKSGVAIKKIDLKGVLQTPGRSVPWVDDGFNYSVAGGIEPGETKKLDLVPNMFGEWDKVPKDSAKSAVLTLVLTGIDDASGKHIGE